MHIGALNLLSMLYANMHTGGRAAADQLDADLVLKSLCRKASFGIEPGCI